jgi:hypothetical protein
MFPFTSSSRIHRGTIFDALKHPTVRQLQTIALQFSKECGPGGLLAVVLSALPSAAILKDATRLLSAQNMRNFLTHLKNAVLLAKWCDADTLRNIPQLSAPSKQSLEAGINFLETSGLLPFYAAYVSAGSPALGSDDLVTLEPILRPTLTALRPVPQLFKKKTDAASHDDAAMPKPPGLFGETLCGKACVLLELFLQWR